MGVKDLWHEFGDGGARPMAEWASSFFAEHKRKPKVALDTPQWLVGVVQKSSSWGFNEHRQLMRRFAAFMTAGIDLVAVFDGLERPHKIRHKRHSRIPKEHAFVLCAKQMVRALGLPCIVAPGEAEAQCSFLQRTGKVDFVFSDDADVLIFGATAVVSYAKQQAGDLAMSRRLRQFDVTQNRLSYLLQALLQGNDYDKGVARMGSKVAAQIADPQTGFAARLEAIVLQHGSDPELLRDWRDAVMHEMHTNESKFLTRRCSATLPDFFPKPEILQALLTPAVAPATLAWSPPDLAKLQAIWMAPSPVTPSATALRALSTRDEVIQVTKKKRSPREALADGFAKCMAPVMLVYHVWQHTDDPLWYEGVKPGKLAGDTVEIALSPRWPYGPPVSAIVPYLILRLSSYVVRPEKRKNHLVTELFAKRAPAASAKPAAAH